VLLIWSCSHLSACPAEVIVVEFIFYNSCSCKPCSSSVFPLFTIFIFPFLTVRKQCNYIGVSCEKSLPAECRLHRNAQFPYEFFAPWNFECSCLFLVTFMDTSRNSSVGITTSCSIDGRGTVPGRGRIFFSSSQCPDRLWGPPSLPSNWYLGPFSPGVKRRVKCRGRIYRHGLVTFLMFDGYVNSINFRTAFSSVFIGHKDACL
jgi:hypothetical protein